VLRPTPFPDDGDALMDRRGIEADLVVLQDLQQALQNLVAIQRPAPEMVGCWADHPAYAEVAGVVAHWLWHLPSEPLLHSLARLRRVMERELQ
jgi:hypothetical protein